MNKYDTFHLIGKILSMDLAPGNIQGVINELQKKDINWNGLVKLASDNLVLPAIYLKLYKHNLIYLLPQGLADYLNDILSLNRERNHKVIQQADYVRKLLSEKRINCILLKGTANIVDGLYEDVGERMVYDIDLLVEPDSMIKAAETLLENGFVAGKEFLKGSLESTMHYPILLREDFVAGVEIHRYPVQYLYQQKFDSRSIWETMHHSLLYKGFNVMSYHHRIIHNFIHSQLMHSAHYHGEVSLRDLYDLLLLSTKADLQEVFNTYGFYKNAATGYCKMMYQVFAIEPPEELKRTKSGNNLLWRHRRVLSLKERSRRRYHLFIMITQKYLVLPMRVLWNRKARNYVLARLTTISWYSYHLRAMGKILKGR